MYDLIKLSYGLYSFSVDILIKEKPDIVINDSLTSCGKIAAITEKIPTVCFIIPNHYVKPTDEAVSKNSDRDNRW
jgi:hypothetical protein